MVSKKTLSSFLKAAVGLAAGVGLLWWLLRGTSWAQLAESVRTADWRWFVPAFAIIVACFFLRILRWQYIVRAVTPASFRNLFSATQIGFLANFTLPARAGEIIRPIVLARLTGITFSKSLALNALDRVADLVCLMVVVVVVVLAFRPAGPVPIPPELFGRPIEVPSSAVRTGAIGAGVVLVAVVGILVLLYINQRLVLRASDAVLGRVSPRVAAYAHHMLEQFAEGLVVFRSGADMAKSVFFSLVMWGGFMLAAAFLFSAFHLDYPWYAPFVMQAMLAAGISIPGTPGFVGQFQVPIVAAIKMTVPEADFSDALAIALIMHLLNFLLVVVFGVAALYMEGFSLVQLRRESEETRAQEAGEAPPA